MDEINPRPHLGGGGGGGDDAPRSCFSAVPHTIWDGELNFSISAFLTFLQIVSKVPVSTFS